MREISARYRCWLYRGMAGAMLLGNALSLGLAACKAESANARPEVVTQIQALNPAADHAAAPALTATARPLAPGAAAPAEDELGPDSSDDKIAYCRQVELQARETNASLPQRLDKDTSATRIAAYGCDVVMEYAMVDLRVSDVAVNGVFAMRDDVIEKLCSDRGARGVMAHGGSFTNVYRDDRSSLIDQFTIGAEDCAGRSMVEAPASVDL